MGRLTTILNLPGNYLFTPDFTGEIEVEAYGGGGGGGSGGRSSGGGAGGGGAYSRDTVKVVSGVGYLITVGSGGLGGTSGDRGSAGTDSSFADLVLARGGLPGAGMLPEISGLGGLSENGFGTIRYSGGNGTVLAVNSTHGGGGGSSAGPTGDGTSGANNIVPSTGGIAPLGGGDGGDGGTFGAAGLDGRNPGGAGGGGGPRHKSGGNGAPGMVVVTWQQ